LPSPYGYADTHAGVELSASASCGALATVAGVAERGVAMVVDVDVEEREEDKVR
jgi:hypothetical protein